MRSPTFRFLTLLLLTPAIHLALLPDRAVAQASPRPQPATTNPPPQTFSGDGLSLIIRADSGSELSGDLQHGEATYPFSAKRSRAGGTETIQGTFQVGTQSFDFRATRRDGDSNLAFTSGGETYTLVPEAAPEPVNPLAVRPAPAEPKADPMADSHPAPDSQPKAQASPALMLLQGEGLTIRVLALDEDEGSVTGELSFGGAALPFSGEIYADDDSESVRGSFRDGAESVPFSTKYLDDGSMSFTARGRTYRLQELDPTSADGAAPADSPSNPPGDSKRSPRPGPSGPAALPGQIIFRQVEFRDINMNNVVAYTMLVPDGWKADGYIEWSNDKTPYPQRKITVTGPDQSRIAFFPALSFFYSEITDVARRESAQMGVSIIAERQGTPPPVSLGDWIVANAYQNLAGASDIRLLSDVRDQEAERARAAMAQASGVATSGEWEIHLVTVSLDLNGIPFTEELNISYAKNPPSYTRNMNMYTWMLFINSCVRAPSVSFAQTKPILYASSQSLRAVPKWWTQQLQAIMQITQSNFKNGMDAIRARAQFYDQMSDDNYASWKRQNTSSDGQQNDRINGIYEVQDFRDTDGLGVKLPIHYQNYYTDGNGNYLMTNTSDQPSSDWTRLEPEK